MAKKDLRVTKIIPDLDDSQDFWKLLCGELVIVVTLSQQASVGPA
jgi:hypothetical protein